MVLDRSVQGVRYQSVVAAALRSMVFPAAALGCSVQCTSPVMIQVPGRWPGLLVPCGKCMSCRVSRTREWAVRLVHELSYWKDSSFLTLTYADDYLPAYGSLSKADLQKFFKRLRKNLMSSGRQNIQGIKYYAAGEYGDTTQRPHYHIIMFGYRPADLYSLKKGLWFSKSLMELWPFGNNSVGAVTYDSCRYTTEYITKKIIGKEERDTYGDRESPFALMSKGLGKQFAIDNVYVITKNLSCTLRGKNVGLPRYYKKVLDIDPEVMADKAISNESRVAEYYEARPVRKKIINTESLALNALDESSSVIADYEYVVDLPGSLAVARKQADKNIRARLSLRRKPL